MLKAKLVDVSLLLALTSHKTLYTRSSFCTNNFYIFVKLKWYFYSHKKASFYYLLFCLYNVSYFLPNGEVKSKLFKL